MNGTVRRLLKGYLARSTWVYAVAGVLAYMVSSASWALKFGRLPLAAALLGVWGSAVAFYTRSLVWRSLPIDIADIAVYRWWAAVGVPGSFLTLITLLSWGAQLSARLPVPAVHQVLIDVLANWAALGLVGALLDAIRCPSTRSKVLAAAKPIALTVLAAMFTVFGLTRMGGSVWIFYVLVGAGLQLLLLGALHARGADRRWAYASSANRFRGIWNVRSETAPAHYGFKALWLPALRHTLILTVTATLGLAAVHELITSRGFPNAGFISLLVVLAGMSSASHLLTYRLRTAVQPLRCLPMGVNCLAGLLQILGVLPGFAAAMLTMLTVRWVLRIDIDIWAGTSFALMVFGSLAAVNQSQIWKERNLQSGGRFVRKWLHVIQALLVPGWFALTFANVFISGLWSSPSPYGAAMRWIWLPLCSVLFAAGHYGMVRHLRAGIRPSANQNAFSSG
jgi:hypothetical protein